MKKLSSVLYKHMVKVLGRLTAGLPEYSCKEPLQADKDAKLTFIAWGDPQISVLSPLRAGRVFAACRDVLAAEGVFDALLLLGDITEYGAWCEYRMAARLLAPLGDKVRHMLAVPGNHDVRLRCYRRQVRRFAEFIRLLPGGIPNGDGGYCFAQDVNGYRFVMMGADKTKFEASYISEAQLRFVDEELRQADKSKPVFVLNHQPLKNTCGLPITWLGRGKWRGTIGRQSDALRAIFEQYNNVIFITGHLHYGTDRYIYEDYGAFKCVSLPTVGVINHGACSHPSQGLVFSVYEDRVLVRSRLFGEGKYVGGDVPGACFEIPVEKNE